MIILTASTKTCTILVISIIPPIIPPTITFNAKGGTLTGPATVNVTHGNTLEEPSNPQLEGKVFDGWCVDETTTTLFDFSTKITGKS